MPKSGNPRIRNPKLTLKFSEILKIGAQIREIVTGEEQIGAGEGRIGEDG